ncbi:MAG: adenylyl-sulfate kinase [Microscillaceae bacterium]|nr:adenylyl-sulfate kinase [Microscillaceae bacterium]
MENKFIVPQHHRITKTDRQTLAGHRSCVLWFTGLSGSGKSTIADLLEQKLYGEGYRTYILDGDNIRAGLCKDLGFSAEDRRENIRRIGEVAKLMLDAGVIVLSAFISPFQEDRDQVRNLLEKGEFIEIFVSCPLEICEQRDVKGLYKKARAGEIKNFTGIDSPFEVPLQPELVVHSDRMSPEEAVEQVYELLIRTIQIS